MTTISNHPEITIATAFARLLSDWLDTEALYAPTLRFRLERLSDRVTLADWAELLSEAARLKPLQPVGLNIGAAVRVRHTGVLGYLILNSPNLGHALETYIDCEHQFYGLNLARLEKTPSTWSMVWPTVGLNGIGLVVEVAFAALFSFLRQRFGVNCQLKSVALANAKPDNAHLYTQFFDCPVQYGNDRPGLRFSVEHLEQPVQINQEGEFADLHNEQVQAFSQVVNVHDRFLEQLQQVMLRLLPEGQSTLTNVASAMYMTPRTLQRHLAEYDLGYQGLIDALRERLAKNHLRRSSLTLPQIAQLLGYSEQSAFQRAFKCWAGATPGQYRYKTRIQGGARRATHLDKKTNYT